jgi:hypothetical protein
MYIHYIYIAYIGYILYIKHIMFYQQIDIIFDNLFQKYGYTDELMEYKSTLIDVYESESYMIPKELMKKIQVRYFRVDKEGTISSK